MAAPRDAALKRLSLAVGRRLRRAGLMIATAESCTGGLLAKCLTDIAGSSDYFERGWVTYSNAAKQANLGVAPGLIERPIGWDDRVWLSWSPDAGVVLTR